MLVVGDRITCVKKRAHCAYRKRRRLRSKQETATTKNEINKNDCDHVQVRATEEGRKKIVIIMIIILQFSSCCA